MATSWEFLRGQQEQFPCPTCKESLVPVFTQDRYAFAFGCSAGHVVSLGDLFERQTVALRQCFESMIVTWETSIRQMDEGARVARRHGSQDLAQRLERRVAALQVRVLLFRETFLKADEPEAAE